MSTWRMLDLKALRSLVTAMSNTSWSWRPDEVEELFRQLGWQWVERIDGRGGVADAGWGLGGHDVMVVFRDGLVDVIRMRITQIVHEAGPSSGQFLDDAFADAVAVATSALGAPTARDPSDPPSVRWRMVDSTLLVGRFDSSITMTWASNPSQDRWDAVAEALA